MYIKNFTEKELLFFKDYCIDMLDLFIEEQKLEKIDFIFMNKTENLFISKEELLILFKKIENLLK